MRIEGSGGLVGEDGNRRTGDGARNGDALLLAAADVGREGLILVPDADEIEEAMSFGLCFAAADAFEGETELDVFADAERGERD